MIGFDDTFTSNNTNNVDISSNKTFFDDSIIRKALVYRMSLTGKAVGLISKKSISKYIYIYIYRFSVQ